MRICDLSSDVCSSDLATIDGYVAVIEVSGLLDRVLVDFVETQLEAAEEADATALVLQLNSGGAVVADDRLEALVERIEAADVPVAVWVGPSGSRATEGATQLDAAPPRHGGAPGRRVANHRATHAAGTHGGDPG